MRIGDYFLLRKVKMFVALSSAESDYILYPRDSQEPFLMRWALDLNHPSVSIEPVWVFEAKREIKIAQNIDHSARKRNVDIIDRYNWLRCVVCRKYRGMSNVSSHQQGTNIDTKHLSAAYWGPFFFVERQRSFSWWRSGPISWYHGLCANWPKLCPTGGKEYTRTYFLSVISRPYDTMQPAAASCRCRSPEMCVSQAAVRSLLPLLLSLQRWHLSHTDHVPCNIIMQSQF